MKAWKIERLGGKLSFVEAPIPEVRPGSVLIRVEAQSLMSYLKAALRWRPKKSCTLRSLRSVVKSATWRTKLVPS
jgi:hypothetical protein